MRCADIRIRAQRRIVYNKDHHTAEIYWASEPSLRILIKFHVNFDRILRDLYDPLTDYYTHRNVYLKCIGCNLQFFVFVYVSPDSPKIDSLQARFESTVHQMQMHNNANIARSIPIAGHNGVYETFRRRTYILLYYNY